mgnify:CR=1 FL=1
MKRVMVCVVNNWPYLHSYFVESFANLITYTREQSKNTRIWCDFRFVWGAYVDVMRNESASVAIKGQYDYLIMLDADMVYPKETIIKLVGHDKDVVGGLYYWKTLKPFRNKKGAGYAPHAYKKFAGDIFSEYSQYLSIQVEKQEQDLVEVDGLGGGGMCIKREVLEKVARPQFECTWDSTELSGEDLDFCKKAKSKGFKLFCDLSVKFGHLTQAAVDQGKLLDLTEYALKNHSLFTNEESEDVVIKPDESINVNDLQKIVGDIKGKNFVGEIRKAGGKENGKTKNN